MQVNWVGSASQLWTLSCGLPGCSATALIEDYSKKLLVITSPALPGVVIQLDGHGAKRLAMTVGAVVPSLGKPR